jgi:Holliday junction DNA helicase RuvA
MIEDQSLVKLWIESMVHDGQEHLFGFVQPSEQTWFQWLVAISGVGGRVAMNILSFISPNILAETIRQGNVVALRSVDGVGPKLANRLVTELKDKANDWIDKMESSLTEGPLHQSGQPNSHSSVHQDAILALVALGYRRAESEAAVLRISAQYDIDSVGQMLTQCLPILSSS